MRKRRKLWWRDPKPKKPPRELPQVAAAKARYLAAEKQRIAEIIRAIERAHRPPF